MVGGAVSGTEREAELQLGTTGKMNKYGRSDR